MDKRCDKCNTPLQYTEGKLLYCALCNIEYVSLVRRVPSEDEVQRALAHRICKNCKHFREWVYCCKTYTNCNRLAISPLSGFGCNQWEEKE